MMFKSDTANMAFTGTAGGSGYAITGSDIIVALTIGVLAVQFGFYCWKWYTSWKDRQNKKE